MSDLTQRIRELGIKNEAYLVSMRRHFHRFPEVSWKETETSRKIVQELTDAGIPAEMCCGTGVVGEIKGGKPGKCGNKEHAARILYGRGKRLDPRSGDLARF